MLEVKEVLNAKGSPIVLNQQEAFMASVLQKKFDTELRNAFGFELNITTLTAIHKKVVEQKFFQIAPSDYMPVVVGQNAWSSQITTYRDFIAGGDFEQGNINLAVGESKLAETKVAIDSITNPVVNWAKRIGWTVPELKMASTSGNWDLISSKEKSRKRNWDLGIQRIAFLGSTSNTSVLGLLTQSTVTSNTSLITAKLSGLSATDFSTFVASVIEAYRSNCARTVMPNRFVIPEGDYNGLAAPFSSTYPNVSKLDYLLQAFKLITMNQDFKILPCAYCDQANNATVAGLNKNRYVLYHYDEDSGRMDIPVDYTNTMQNTLNGFTYENVGFGQYTGFLAYRPPEFLYFDF